MLMMAAWHAVTAVPDTIAMGHEEGSPVSIFGFISLFTCFVNFYITPGGDPTSYSCVPIPWVAVWERVHLNPNADLIGERQKDILRFNFVRRRSHRAPILFKEQPGDERSQAECLSGKCREKCRLSRRQRGGDAVSCELAGGTRY